jgi:hypothetical protein
MTTNILRNKTAINGNATTGHVPTQSTVSQALAVCTLLSAGGLEPQIFPLVDLSLAVIILLQGRLLSRLPPDCLDLGT